MMSQYDYLRSEECSEAAEECSEPDWVRNTPVAHVGLAQAKGAEQRSLCSLCQCQCQRERGWGNSCEMLAQE